MHPTAPMRQYQRQAIASSSPAQLVLKLYDLGVQCCRQDDRVKLRRVLAELVGSLNLEEGGDIAERLYDLYEYCISESITGDLDLVQNILGDLRDVWKEGVLARQAA